jgi:sugar phosphate isomerase/epimerase
MSPLPVLSLAYLTYAPLPPPETVSLAAELGYDAVGLRLLPVAPGGGFDPLIEGAALLRETIARMQATGISVFDVEIVRLGPAFDPETVRPFLETCARLGAKAVLVAGDDPEEARLTASFAAFCEAAAPYGVTGDLEFMPWTEVPDARTARRIVQGAAQPNARVLVDSLHVARSATTLADVAALPGSLLSYAQMCDAPGEVPATTEGLIHTARQARLIPGDGGIDLAGIFAQLPPDLPVSVEIPNQETVARIGVRAWAERALAATKTVLAQRDAAIARGDSLRREDQP